MENESYVLYHISLDQVEKICNHFNKNMSDLEEYEICELLYKIIYNKHVIINMTF